MGALNALQRGSSAEPALQNITCLFSAACIDLTLPQPRFQLAADSDVEDLPSPAVLARSAVDSSTPRLCRVIGRLAFKADIHFSLDLFASCSNAWGPQYFSETSNVAAEGLDAFAQPSCSSFRCPVCARARPKYVLLYPPFPLIRAALLRAQADQAHDILVVPYTATSPWWHTVLLASSTRVGPIQRALRLPCSNLFVSTRSNPADHFLAVLHFDFWQGPSPRPRPCLHTLLPRARQAGSRTPACDPPDCLAIRQALAMLLDAPLTRNHSRAGAAYRP